jgi:hypothetical protein
MSFKKDITSPALRLVPGAKLPISFLPSTVPKILFILIAATLFFCAFCTMGGL